MEEIKIYKFDDSDYELLNKDYPKNPCVACTFERSNCCGCAEEVDYKLAIRHLIKNEALFDIYNTICLIRDLNARIKKDIEKTLSLREELREMNIDLNLIENIQL